MFSHNQMAATSGRRDARKRLIRNHVQRVFRDSPNTSEVTLPLKNLKASSYPRPAPDSGTYVRECNRPGGTSPYSASFSAARP